MLPISTIFSKEYVLQPANVHDPGKHCHAGGKKEKFGPEKKKTKTILAEGRRASNFLELPGG